MSLWIPHPTKGEEEQFRYVPPSQQLCIHCHAYAILDDDGWCRACTGDGPTADEIGMRCRRATLKSSRLILLGKQARNDSEREIQWWRDRVAWLEARTGESVEGEI